MPIAMSPAKCWLRSFNVNLLGTDLFVTLSRTHSLLLLMIAAIFFGFTLLQASWLADKPVGKPRLIADHGVDPVRDAAGCTASANAGYGTVSVGPDIGALQGAVGAGADAIRIMTEVAGGTLLLAPQFDSICAADQMRVRPAVAEAAASMTKPELFWQIKGADQAAMLLAALPPSASQRSAFLGDGPAVTAIRKAQPAAWAFSVPQARMCAADYRLSGLWGSVPTSCADGTMLLTLDDLGYTLWGWPDRFLQRMAQAKIRVIIAEDVVYGRIKGLSDVTQYGEIADSYNGHIWVDNIAELGPALKR
jgi:glycerophosphoryl diester phosphodiesterase